MSEEQKKLTDFIREVEAMRKELDELRQKLKEKERKPRAKGENLYWLLNNILNIYTKIAKHILILYDEETMNYIREKCSNVKKCEAEGYWEQKGDVLKVIIKINGKRKEIASIKLM